MYRFALLVIAGCATGAGETPDASRTASPDAARGAPDANPPGPRPDANPAAPDAEPPPPPAAAVPLLLTEIAMQPNAGEFIEIGNPTGSAVDLAPYYLSDNGNYWKLPAGTTNVGSSDFVARFPAGASIAAHSVAVVALDTAANFHTQTGATANWSIADGTMTVVDGSAATITNTGEIVALFYWDGASDLVTDIDLMIAGVPTSGNGLVPKGGVAIDGPDPGTTTTAYPAEADTLPAQTSAPGTGKSTKRILLPSGHETAGDQTSEDTSVTWDATFTTSTPGTTTLAL